MRGKQKGHTKQEELPAVPVELSQVYAELVDGGTVTVFME